MKTIVCMRHGRTAWNAAGRFQGISDIPLDDVGREQVAVSAKTLHDEAFSYFCSSDLVRAKETLQIVLHHRRSQANAEVDVAWRERAFGDWEGLTWAEITARTSELAHAVAIDVRAFEPPNGEPFEHVKTRIRDAFAQTCNRIADGQAALVVAHAGVLHALLDVVLGASRPARMITHAAMLRFHVHGDRIEYIEDIA